MAFPQHNSLKMMDNDHNRHCHHHFVAFPLSQRVTVLYTSHCAAIPSDDNSNDDIYHIDNSRHNYYIILLFHIMIK